MFVIDYAVARKNLLTAFKLRCRIVM